MGKPSAPKPPDPAKTAAAQTGSNVSTAIANAFLGNVNQITPEGSLTFDQTGTFSFVDRSNPKNPQTFDIPRFTATQSLSEQGQKLKGITDAADINLATIGRDQSAKVGELLSSPFEIGNEATEARLFELGSKRLGPLFERREEALRTRLANQGVQLGSEGFDRSLSRFGETRNDAFNQLLLTGRGQAVQEGLTERNQPINEITALLSGSQVSQPNFIGAGLAGQPSIPTTDIAGIFQQDFQNRLAARKADPNIAGGLFQLGSAGITAYGLAAASDRRLKRDIVRVGTTDSGLPLYLFNYLTDERGTQPRLGLMADDVEKVRPDAVWDDSNGFKMVDYAKALEA